MTLYIDTRPTLEWVGRNKSQVCDTIFGQYVCYPTYDHSIDKGIVTLYLSVITIYEEDGEVTNLSHHNSFEAAKAAAQADYDRRTADRFRKVEIPVDAPFDNNLHTDMVHGYDTAIDALLEAIAKAKDNTL